MGDEIKGAIELAMEKTKDMVLSTKEAEEIHLKERQGISGSAVKPNVKGSPKYEEASEKARKDCELKLSELKQRMKGTLKS